MVLNELTRINYVPNLNARNLVTGKNNAVGVLIPGEYARKSIYFADTLDGMIQESRECGKDILFHKAPESDAAEGLKNFRLFLNRIDGLLVFNVGADRNLIDSFMEPIIKSSKNFMLIDNQPHKKHPFATIDNFHGGYIAVDYLLRLGHRKICFVSVQDRLFEYIEREKGFHAAFEKHGNPDRNAYALNISDPAAMGTETEEILSLPAGRRPTAFFAVNDRIARVLTIELEKRGYSVPGDFSIIGFNDVKRETELMHPFLTTVRQPFQQLGINAMKHLLSEEHRRHGFMLKPELVERETCSAPPKRAKRSS